MDVLDPFLRLGAALAIGFLVGFERGWRKREEPEGARTAGLRTFALIGVLGGIAGVLGQAFGAVVIAAGFVAVAALAIAIYFASIRAEKHIGATTEFATLVTYGLGALAGHGEITLAVAAAVVIVALLDIKAPLHGLLLRIQRDEIRAALKLLLVSAVLLPILPNKGYGPGEILNPYQLWWIVVLVAGLSLVGHFAHRFAGPSSGPILTGLLGGLVSSTVLTVSAARLSAKSSHSAAAQAASVAAGQAVMCARILVIAGIVNPALAATLAVPLSCAAIASIAGSYVLARDAGDRGSTAGRGSERVPLQAPDDLGAAIAFAAVLAIVMLVSYYARETFGISGLYATAALTGLVDVDAITVAAAAIREGSAATIISAILIAAAVNTMVKIGISLALGTRAFARRVAILVAAVIAAGALGYAIVA